MMSTRSRQKVQLITYRSLCVHIFDKLVFGVVLESCFLGWGVSCFGEKTSEWLTGLVDGRVRVLDGGTLWVWWANSFTWVGYSISFSILSVTF